MDDKTFMKNHIIESLMGYVERANRSIEDCNKEIAESINSITECKGIITVEEARKEEISKLLLHLEKMDG